MKGHCVESRLMTMGMQSILDRSSALSSLRKLISLVVCDLRRPDRYRPVRACRLSMYALRSDVRSPL